MEGSEEEMGAGSRLRAFLRASYGLPVLVFLFLRLDDAGFFFWGVLNKAPWNGWGCTSTSSLAPGFCVPGVLQVEAANMPFGAGGIITQFVLPNIAPFEWFQFSLELVLTVTLLFGIVTRFFALTGTLWAAFLMAAYVWVPGEVFPDSILFILLPLALVTIRGGNLLTVDRYLRPALLRSSNRLGRAIARWMF